MNDRHCANCYFHDKCGCSDVCEDFIPLTEEDIENEFEEFVENDRMAFRNEWFLYIENFNR